MFRHEKVAKELHLRLVTSRPRRSTPLLPLILLFFVDSKQKKENEHTTLIQLIRQFYAQPKSYKTRGVH